MNTTKLRSFLQSPKVNLQIGAEKISAAASEAFCSKSYRDENMHVYTATNWISIFLQVSSAALAVAFFAALLPVNYYIAIFIALVICSVVEIAKRIFITAAFKAYLKGNSDLFSLAISLLLIAVSIASSYFGGQISGEAISSNQGEIIATRAIYEDSLISVYGTEIQSLKKRAEEINSLRPKRWAKTLMPAEYEELSAVNKRIDFLMGEQSSKLAASEAEATRAINEDKSSSSFSGKITAVISIVFELLNLLCFMFMSKYLHNVYLEELLNDNRLNDHSINDSRSKIDPVISDPVISDPGIQKPGPQIGFQPPTVKHNLQTGNRICKNCEGVYVYKSFAQKFCSDKCRIENWEKKTGAKVKFNGNNTSNSQGQGIAQV